MTDEAKALVERLRWGAWYYEDPFDGKAYASDDPLEAADRIEALSAEKDRLREALKRSGEGWENAIELGLIPERHRNTAQILAEKARAALAGDSNDQ